MIIIYYHLDGKSIRRKGPVRFMFHYEIIIHKKLFSVNKNTKWENVGTEQHSNTNWFFFRKIESVFWARLLTLWTYSTTHRHTRSPPILPSKMVITKTENFNLFRCDRRFVSLNVVHLFKMVKTCNSGIIHKQKRGDGSIFDPIVRSSMAV